jgi:Skp family chaperone for outer membrane proteins
MNQLILRTSLAALLAATVGLAQAQTAAGSTGTVTGANPQGANSDQVIPGKEAASKKMKKAPKAKSEKLEPAGADMSAKGNAAKTGPNATGSAGSGKTP